MALPFAQSHSRVRTFDPARARPARETYPGYEELGGQLVRHRHLLRVHLERFYLMVASKMLQLARWDQEGRQGPPMGQFWNSGSPASRQSLTK